MRATMMFLALLCLGVNAKAQIGLSAGGAYSNLRWFGDASWADPANTYEKPALGFYVGIKHKLGVHEKIDLHTGLGFSHMKMRSKWPQNTVITWNYNYLELPITFSCKFLSKSSFDLGFVNALLVNKNKFMAPHSSYDFRIRTGMSHRINWFEFALAYDIGLSKIYHLSATSPEGLPVPNSIWSKSRSIRVVCTYYLEDILNKRAKKRRRT